MKTAKNIVPRKQTYLDRLGIYCSFACIIHCFSVPILLIFSPVIAGLFENEFVHILLLAIILPVAFISFKKQRKIHKNSTPTILGAIGILLLFLSLAVDMVSHNQYLEIGLSIAGGLLLISAHYLNIKKLQAYYLVQQFEESII